MDFRGFTACAIIALCLIKQSDAAITAWVITDSASATATVSGTEPDGIASVSIAENSAAANLFTVAATGATTALFSFATDGNPDSIATDPIVGGAITLASGKSLDFETTPSIVFMIKATETTDTAVSGTVTVTLSVTDAVEFTKIAFCLSSSSIAAGASVGTLATDQTSTTYTASAGTDMASFTIATATGAITATTALATTTKTYYTFTTTGAATGVATSSATDIHVLINCSSDSGAAQVAALLSVLILSVVTALFY